MEEVGRDHRPAPLRAISEPRPKLKNLIDKTSEILAFVAICFGIAYIFTQWLTT